ncbi:unnamed protein product [Hymenolepis diminuta]|uniref:Uncharacterized protein n=1 Tax=Hymenolepis diminuta TaxID=6216 RepID=A0A564ZD50_HYMDI|nr:unnamed protein product [Hymenolepis diminuta]
MPDITIGNKMERHAEIMSTKAKRSNLKIARFLEVAKSYDCRVRRELNEKHGNELAITRKRKEHCQRSAHSLGTPVFVGRVHGMA